jgi:hypothetical protein
MKKLSLLLLFFITLITSLFPRQPTLAAELCLYERYGQGLAKDNIYGKTWKGQIFTPSIDHIVQLVRLNLKKEGNPLGNVVVSIRETDGNGRPKGEDLASASIPCSSLTEMMTWYDFNLGSGYDLKAGTRYAICWRAPNATSSNAVWYAVNTSGAYSGGWVVQSYHGGTSWTDLPTYDAVFEELGEGVPPPLPPPVADPKIIGYIQGSKIAQNVFNVLKLEQLTHLVYTFVEVRSAKDPTLVCGWGWDYISQCVAAGHGKGVKVLVSLYGSPGLELDAIVKSDALRASLVTNIKNMVMTYNLDGVDIDWESGEPQAEMDKLITDLYAVLHPLNKLITISASWYRHDVSLAVSDYVDFFSLLTYGMNQPHPLPYMSLYDDSVAAMNLWADAGYDRTKILMGIPFYASDSDGNVTTYGTVVDVLNPDPGQNQASISSISGVTVDGGVLWWNGINLAKQKVTYVKTNGFGGVMLYSIEEDKLNDSRSLLQNIYNEMYPTEITPPAVIKSDVNNDGVVNILDIISVVQNLHQSVTIDLIEKDVNNDGNIDILDIILIDQHFIEL